MHFVSHPRHFPGSPRGRAGGCAWLALVFFGMAISAAAWPQRVCAQAAWEFSPYEVKICIAFADEPEFTAQFAASSTEDLANRADIVFFATWKTTALAANSKVAGQLLSEWDQLSYDSLLAADSDLVKGDKLYLLVVTRDGSDYLARGRELDLRTRILGPTTERRCGTLPGIPLACWDLVTASFVPLAKIETIVKNEITARVRAGGLITDPGSLALIQPGEALRPIIRRNERTGELAKNGIQPVAWTILSVQSREDSLLNCTVASGYRTPIPTRASARMERLAVVARPRLPATSVVLQSRGKDPHPLTGYEVYVKGVDDKPTELLGVTDWRGSIDIPRGDVPVRTLYVKNGNQLLARLPLVPGDEREAVATTIEDDYRLQTEGFLIALQGRVTDLVARREILAARIRKRIAEGKFDEAESLLENYRQLESRDDLIRDVDKQQGDIGDNDAALDKLTKARINKLMGEARTLLQNIYLNPETKNVLAKEVEQAKAGNAAAAGS